MKWFFQQWGREGECFFFFVSEREIFISINFPRTICRWLVAVWLHVLWKYFHTLRAKKNKNRSDEFVFFFFNFLFWILKIETSVKIKSCVFTFFLEQNSNVNFFFFFLDFALRNTQSTEFLFRKCSFSGKSKSRTNIRIILRIF